MWSTVATVVNRCSLTVFCERQNGKKGIDGPWIFTHLPTIAVKNARDRIFFIYSLPYLVGRGVALSGVPETSHSLDLYARPSDRFPGFWLAVPTSSWKTWLQSNVWQVEDIVFTMQPGGVLYSAGILTAPSGNPVTRGFERNVLGYYITARLAYR